MAANDSMPQGQEDKPPERKKMPKGDIASSSRPAHNKIFAKQQWVACLIGSSLVALTVVASCSYFWDGKPIFLKQSTRQSPASALAILGEYNNEVYLFKGKEKKIYAHAPANKSKPVFCEFDGLDASFRYSASKSVLLSSAYNPLGGLYLLDLTQQPPPPKPELITNREDDPYFPPDLSLESTLPLTWATSGNLFAFVARDKEKNVQSLFIYDLPNKKLIETPVQNFERITELVWIKNDTELVFTGMNNGREKIYRVNSLGGDFRTWDAQP